MRATKKRLNWNSFFRRDFLHSKFKHFVDMELLAAFLNSISSWLSPENLPCFRLPQCSRCSVWWGHQGWSNLLVSHGVPGCAASCRFCWSLKFCSKSEVPTTKKNGTNLQEYTSPTISPVLSFHSHQNSPCVTAAGPFPTSHWVSPSVLLWWQSVISPILESCWTMSVSDHIGKCHEQVAAVSGIPPTFSFPSCFCLPFKNLHCSSSEKVNQEETACYFCSSPTIPLAAVQL